MSQEGPRGDYYCMECSRPLEGVVERVEHRLRGHQLSEISQVTFQGGVKISGIPQPLEPGKIIHFKIKTWGRPGGLFKIILQSNNLRSIRMSTFNEIPVNLKPGRVFFISSSLYVPEMRTWKKKMPYVSFQAVLESPNGDAISSDLVGSYCPEGKTSR